LQIPYLLALALLVVDTMPGFAPAPKTMFRLLHKLDSAFASLMQGVDMETGEPLPGFESGQKVNDTEKVRIKSLVERTRLTVVDVMSSGDFEASEAEPDETDADSADNMDGNVELPDLETGWEMEIAKVYDRTILELGDTIGGTPIGIVTDD
jgi:hypothetical protein